MSKLSLTLSFMLVATGAFAIGELPVVNPARTVSALDLYGAPHERKAVAEKKREVRIAKAADSDLLIPNRPAIYGRTTAMRLCACRSGTNT